MIADIAHRSQVKSGLSDHTIGSVAPVLAEDMKAGDVITEKNVRSVRPGYGAAPKYLPEVIGKRVKVDLEKGMRFLVEYAE